MKSWEKIVSIIVCFASGTMWASLLYQVIHTIPPETAGIDVLIGVIFLQVAVVVSFSLMVYVIFEEMEGLE